MLFSVVIPVFNRRDLLSITLRSLWSQTFTDFETIIVDDGSTDGTREYLRGLGDRVTVIEQAQLGPGPARNAGVARASGDYIAFLDSDDLWFPWTLATFAQLIAASSPAVLTASYVDYFDDGSLAGVAPDPVTSRTFVDFFASSSTPIAAGSNTIVIRRSEFNASGGFVDRAINGEDHDLMMRLGEAAGFVQVLTPILLAWRQHHGNITAQVLRRVAGMEFLVAQERAGAYPGGQRRAPDRRRIISRHLRAASFAALRAGHTAAAFRLYRATAGWHLHLASWRYLAGLPLAALWFWARGTRPS